MDWLLHSIKKRFPAKTRRYLLKKSGKEEATAEHKNQATKRGREDDGDQEDIADAGLKKVKKDSVDAAVNPAEKDITDAVAEKAEKAEKDRIVFRASLASLVDEKYAKKCQCSPSHSIFDFG